MATAIVTTVRWRRTEVDFTWTRRLTIVLLWTPRLCWVAISRVAGAEPESSTVRQCARPGTEGNIVIGVVQDRRGGDLGTRYSPIECPRTE